MSRKEILSIYILQIVFGALIFYPVQKTSFRLFVQLIKIFELEKHFANIPGYFWLAIGVMSLVLSSKAVYENWKDINKNDPQILKRTIIGWLCIVSISVSIVIIKLGIWHFLPI